MNKLEWIKSQLLPDELASDAASRLNIVMTINNPIPQQKVPAPIDLVAIRNAVSDIEAFNVLRSRIWDRIIDAISTGDLVAVNSHVMALWAGKLISDETIGKLAPFLSATIPDPNWQPTIKTSLAQMAGFDIVYTHEINEVIGNND